MTQVTINNQARLSQHLTSSSVATLGHSSQLDISEESGEAFDELLLERNARGAIWLHFAVRPAGNRKKVLQISS